MPSVVPGPTGAAPWGEQRWIAVGMIADVYVTAIFTWRGAVIRLISMRKARDNERRQHQALLGH